MDTDTEVTKRCPHCGEVKPLAAYAKRAAPRTDYQSWCKGCTSANTRRWVSENRDRAASYTQKWYRANREYAAEYSRRWGKEHKDARRLTRKAWDNANRARVRTHCRERRARLLGARGRATPEQVSNRWAMWGDMCYVCGEPATDTDHVIPLSRGGTNWPANLRPICKHCNSAKWMHDWRPYVLGDKREDARTL